MSHLITPDPATLKPYSMLQHRGADIACGMDFLRYKGPPSTIDVHPYGPDAPPLSVRPRQGGHSAFPAVLHVCEFCRMPPC